MKLEPPCIADTLPAAYLQRIGEIVFIWARLEYQMGVIAREAFGMTKETGRAMTVGMDLGALCGSIRTATLDAHWVADKAVRNDMAKLAGDVRDNAVLRHQHAHGIYGYYDDKPSEFYRYLMKAASHRSKPSKEAVTLVGLETAIAASRALLERSFDVTSNLKSLRKKRN